jgi:hypothetical protein
MKIQAAPAGLSWKKSSRSAAMGAENCVEVARVDGRGVRLRDSKNTAAQDLRVSGTAWSAFVGGIPSP